MDNSLCQLAVPLWSFRKWSALWSSRVKNVPAHSQLWLHGTAHFIASIKSSNFTEYDSVNGELLASVCCIQGSSWLCTWRKLTAQVFLSSTTRDRISCVALLNRALFWVNEETALLTCWRSLPTSETSGARASKTEHPDGTAVHGSADYCVLINYIKNRGTA